MARIILLVSLFLSLLTACDKKEDDMNPGKDYTGLLTLEYTRTFPTFQSVVSTQVDISSSGTVVFKQPPVTAFKGESEKMIENDRIRIREEGSISISMLSGKWDKMDGKEYLLVNLTCQLDGLRNVWEWDEYRWIQLSEVPYSLENPLACPMSFRIDNALMSEAVCGGSLTDNWGINCFRWRLVLVPVSLN
ncbi:MAG TPA: hypothetical protein PLH09_08200 [Lentimicrobium sp.]|jgi:hypothetical protein|nr:hypothetical protein [Lentimicrobium sp.]